MLSGIQFGLQTYRSILDSLVGCVAGNLENSSSVLRDIAKTVMWRALHIQRWIIHLRAKKVLYLDAKCGFSSGSALIQALSNIGEETQAEFVAKLEAEESMESV